MQITISYGKTAGDLEKTRQHDNYSTSFWAFHCIEETYHVCIRNGFHLVGIEMFHYSIQQRVSATISFISSNIIEKLESLVLVAQEQVLHLHIVEKLDNFEGSTFRRKFDKTDNIAKIDGYTFESLGWNIPANLQNVRNLPNQSINRKNLEVIHDTEFCLYYYAYLGMT